MNRAGLLLQMAIRSLAAHRVKSLFVGSILAFGTFLVVFGGAMLDSVQSAMERTITSSLSGHLQVYSKAAKDELSLFGSFGGSDDIGEIPRWEEVEAVAAAHPNVAAVVPMGLGFVTVFGRNEIDEATTDLRDAVGRGDAAAVATQRERVRRIAVSLASGLEARRAIADPEVMARQDEAVERVRSDAFWQGFDADPTGSLDFLETRIAPLASDGRLLYLRAVGTDLDQFAHTFDRFYVVKGEMVPAGQRGVLLSDRTYEELFKNVVARNLDDLKQAADQGKRIADDPLLQELVGRTTRQYQRVVFQLSPADAEALTGELRAFLPDAGAAPLDELVKQLLTVDDATLAARYAFFYDHVASRIKLYDVPLGGEITLRSFTRSGYLRSVNVKVWGTYDFHGLEKASLQGAVNLVDLVSFRDLYGKMSDDQQQELAAIKAEVGVKDIDRGSAEEALFGGGGEIVTDAAALPGAIEVALAPRASRSTTFDPAEQHRGLALNGAIVLRDPSRTDETARELQQAFDARGVAVQLVGWQTAAGLLGQFILVMKGVLYVSLLITFLVALIVINNAMVMATTDRIPEIGTMRAIGAQRGTVLALLLAETVVLGLAAGLLGAALAGGLVAWLGYVGLPAGAEIMVLLFSGPRLYPTVTAGNLAIGFFSVLATALLATLYPAILAARVSPVVAMSGKE